MQADLEPAEATAAPAAIELAGRRELSAPAAAGLIAIFGVSIFTSAFLLFLVEPMIAKMILPPAGGSAPVCLRKTNW